MSQEELIELQSAHVTQYTNDGVKTDWNVRKNITSENLFTLPMRLTESEVFVLLNNVRKYELKARGYNLDSLSHRVEEIFDMEKGEVYSPGNYKRLIKPRSVFCYWAVRELGITATSLAKKLGLTQSGVSKSVLRGKGIVKEMNLKILE